MSNLTLQRSATSNERSSGALTWSNSASKITAWTLGDNRADRIWFKFLAPYTSERSWYAGAGQMQYHTDKVMRLGSLSLPALDQASQAFSAKHNLNARHHIGLMLLLLLRGCDVRFLLLNDPVWEKVAEFFGYSTIQSLDDPKSPIALVCSATESNWDVIFQMEQMVSRLFTVE